MAREPGGAFEYSITVPVDGQNAFPWEMKSREPFEVGSSPLLYIRDSGLPANPGLSVPSVVRNEIRLVATDKNHRSREIGSYFLDRALVRALRPGDIFHMRKPIPVELGFRQFGRGNSFLLWAKSRWYRLARTFQ